MPRHLAILRSICETLGGKPAYCQCGKQVSDKIHFSSAELNTLEAEKKLIQWRGLTVDKGELDA